ncbi:MAG: Hsp20/alpha crystallin family protein [Acidobacteriia bacterium]|nr:Hsp20/alpha crystallin family protein [Terriglobia bacterium]
MAKVRCEPFRDLITLQDRMNRLFDERFGRLRAGDGPMDTGVWSPAVDIYETDHDIVVKAELPEMKEKDIDIRLENDTLTLKGERKLEKETREENYHRVERAYGAFSRSFTLPTSVDQDRITAEYRDGVLKITLPKKAETKSKQIKVNIT